MKEGVYLYYLDDEPYLIELVINYWEIYAETKWERHIVSMTKYTNICGNELIEKTDKIAPIFANLEYLGEL